MAGEEKARSPSVKVETYGDWALQCPEAAPCFLMQRVLLKGKREQPLINFILQFSRKPSRLLIAIRIPLGVVLASGIELRVDKAKAGVYPYHHCRSEGCFAIFPVSRKLRRSLERGKRANVSYLLIDGKRYSIPVSLIGITAGLRALKNAAAGPKP